MKKMLTYALALALAVSLTACSQPKAEQPTDPAPSTSVPVDTSTQEPAATPEPIKDTAPKPTEDAHPPEDGQALEELSHDELLVVFGQQYEISKEIYNSDSEETIQNELEMIRITVECMEKSLPSDYEVQYREWRPSAVQQETQTTETTQQSQNQQSQQSQGQQGQSSKPQGSQTQQPPQQPSQQQQGDSSGDQGSLEGWESFGEVITDPSQIANNQDDPYSGYGEVSIGYGGN